MILETNYILYPFLNPTNRVFISYFSMNSDKKEVVVTDKSPLPLKPSPYSAAVKHGGLVFCSGNIGMDPVSEKLVEGDVGDRTVMIHFPRDYTHLRSTRAVLGAYCLAIHQSPCNRLICILSHSANHFEMFPLSLKLLEHLSRTLSDHTSTSPPWMISRR